MDVELCKIMGFGPSLIFSQMERATGDPEKNMIVDTFAEWQVSKLQKVPTAAKSVTIGKSADYVFSILSDAGHLEKFHPFCQQNVATSWGVDERKDVIQYHSGLRYERQFISWDEGRGFQLLLGASREKRSLVIWSLQEIDAENCKLSISVSPYPYARYPYVANWVAHKLWIEPRLESYLFSVLKGLKRFAETGKTVTENQWGSHPWFSSKTHN